MSYRVWVSDDRCTLFRLFAAENENDEDVAEVATRENPTHTWGPPVTLHEEKTA